MAQALVHRGWTVESRMLEANAYMENALEAGATFAHNS